MKLTYLATAAAAVAFSCGVAQAQAPKAPTPGSVTGDWNGSHAPSDDRQYTETVKVPLGTPAPAAEVAPPEATVSASSAAEVDVTAPTGAAANTSATFTNVLVTNGPIPDTPENRAKYGAPMSHAGKMTAAKGN